MRTRSFGSCFRTLSTVLALAILLVFMPQSVLAEVGEAINPDPTPETVSEEELQSADLACVIGEVDWRRTYNTKTFRLSDGSFTLADYSHKVHFLDESGFWTDYDNTLNHTEQGYRNAASDVYYTFSEICSEGFLQIQSSSYQMRFTLRDAELSEIDVGTPKKTDEEGSGRKDIGTAVQLPRYSSELYYREIAPDTDLRYILQGSDLKEMIVLNSRTEVQPYSFDISLEHLIPEMAEDGSILLKDPDSQEIQFVIPPAFMEDAKGDRSENVSYTIDPCGTGYTLTVAPDPEWIQAEDRAFPVVIDPTLEKYQTQYSGGRIKDTYIKVGENSVHGGWAYMNVGTNNGYENVALIGMADSLSPEYPALPAIPKTATVTSAKLLLRTLDSSGTGVTVGVHQVGEDWNPGTAHGTVPSYDDTVLDYVVVNAAGTGYVLDVTKPVIAWYGDATDTLRSYGFALTALSGSELVSFSTVNNSNYHDQYPMFLISYRDTKGLEGHWQFLSYGAGNAGSGHVNLFNGNLVFINDEISSKGNLLPVTVSHVFNSSVAGEDFTSGTSSITSDFSNMKVGKGWKLSVQETVNRVTLGGRYWYVYSDSDGTELYFLPDTVNGLHMSEDEYPLYLQVNTSGTYKYHLTDDYGNTKYFDWSGRLARMTDAFGNARDFAYTNNRLTSVSLTPAGGSSVTQIQFEYNSANALKKITTPQDSSETVEFYYSTTYNGTASNTASGYLRKISSSKSGTCTFEYNEDGTLAGTKDLDTNYETVYGYALFDGTNRISAVSEKSGSETGQTVGLSFENRTTVVRSSGLNDQYGDSDDLLTTYLTDTYGRVVCSYTSALNPETVYGAACAKYMPFAEGDKRNNKITADAVKGMTVENLLLNHNCESTGNWTGACSGSGYSGSLSSTEKLYGSNSFGLYSSSSASGYYRRYQTVTVPETGTYTFSAYVKTTNVSTGTNAGAYLILDGTESERITGTTNTAIRDGWRRISVTKNLTANASVTIQIRLANASGTAYFDCLQLEKGEVPSDYNFLQNGGMSLTSGGWSSSSVYTVTDGRRAIRVTGDPTAYNYKSQTVALNVPKETTLVLSGWGKADSTSTEKENEANKRTFRVVANLLYTDGTREDFPADFNPNLDGWQYSSAVIVPERDVTSATIYLSYDFNCNYAYYDDVSLTVEPVQTYEYDEDSGKLKSTKNGNGNQSLLEYDVYNYMDLAKFTDIIGTKYCYTYKSVNNVSTHAVETVSKTNSDETTTYQTLSYEYDAYGNAVSSTISSPTVTGVVSSTASYIESGNFLSSVTDSLGGMTAYGYDSVKLLKYVENANSRRTGYLYDSRNRNTAVFLDLDEDGIPDSNEANVQYSYTNNRLTGIATDATSYTLSYDSFGNLTQVKAGNNTLASYMYSIGNGKLQRLTYGNGDYEDYVYDHLDRLVSVKVNGTVTYTLIYDANGFPAKCVDSKAGITHTYEYDGLGRLIRAWQTDTATGVRTLGVENVYDSYGRADKSTYVNGNRTLSYDLTYKTDSNLVSSILMPTSIGSGIGYTYDGLDRLTQKTVSFQTNQNISEEYDYYGYTSGGVQYTTPLVSGLALKQNGVTQISYSYTYDSLGNILTVSENGVLAYAYSYDELNQLKREDDIPHGTISLYDYDLSGNITAKYMFPYYSGISTAALYGLIGDPSCSYTFQYGYSSSSWGDLLTNYEGTTISYDVIGNPTNWKNSTIDVRCMVWEGRKLTALTKDMLFHTLSFEYNADGVRTQKSNVDYVDSQYVPELHDYIVDGTRIVKETITKTVGSSLSTTDTLYYYYDANGSVAGFEYNGTPYYYQKNLQGDIVRICNVNGTAVAQYTYSAWGKVYSITGSLASTVGQINPFRYRGYYYDKEIGFYYLQTRYYDPEVGRFLNADGSINANGTIIGQNVFAYGDNNPVSGSDPLGEDWWHWLAGAAIVAVCAVATVVTCGGFAAAAGAVAAVASGVAAATTASSIAAGALIGSATAYGTAVLVAAAHSNSAEEFAAKGNIRTVVDTFVGAVTGGTTGYLLDRNERKAAQPQSKASKCEAECFIEGTLVLTVSGLVPIENIQEGDWVRSEDPKTGKKDYKRVVQTFVNESYELVHLFIGNEVIVTTPTHPFWVINAEWCSAIEICAGDILKLADGSTVTVTSAEYEKLDSPVKVFNFEVEDFHTYYVGEQAALVHNRCSSVDRMSRQEANSIKKDICNSKDVTFRTKADAESFVTNEYPKFSRDVAGQRSAKGWHYDLHEINGIVREHINIYSKVPKFNSHIFWED